MAKQYPSILPVHRDFISRQQIFFTGSATAESRVNISPRGTDAFRILDDHRVSYLDLTGSGSETAAHLLADGRLTIMFCAFVGAPSILRLYGAGRSHPRGSQDYQVLLRDRFDDHEPAGARQIILLDIDLVQTSCGFGVPLFEHRGDRDTLHRWAAAKGEDGLLAYRREKNARSMDGLPTGLGKPVG